MGHSSESATGARDIGPEQGTVASKLQWQRDLVGRALEVR